MFHDVFRMSRQVWLLLVFVKNVGIGPSWCINPIVHALRENRSVPPFLRPMPVIL